MRLQDGRLYENATGQRFRVRDAGGYFVCPASAPNHWQANGEHETNDFFDLVRQVEELRWIPVPRYYIHEPPDDGIFRCVRGHWQQQVTREQARINSGAEPILVDDVLLDTPHGDFALELFSDNSVWVTGRGTRVRLA